MFFFLSKLLDVFLSPYTWGLVLLGLAVPWRKKHLERWQRRRWFGVAGLAVLLLFSIEPVSNTLLYRLERASAPTYRPDVTYDAVILLGGVSDERVVAETGQAAYNDNVDRLVATHRVLAEGRAKFVIITGAAESAALEEHGEARVLARQLETWGIAADRILREEKARNTRENAVYSAEIVRARQFEKILLVTSAYHMRRSAECFRAVGLAVDTLSTDYRAYGTGSSSLLPRAMFLSESTRVLREMAGLYIYRAQGYAK